jgi:hypothetical protein
MVRIKKVRELKNQVFFLNGWYIAKLKSFSFQEKNVRHWQKKVKSPGSTPKK